MRKTIERSKGTARYAFKDPISELQKDPKRLSLLMLHFAYGTLRFKYSTGYKLCYDDWNATKQEVKNKAHILDRDYMNDFLSDLKNEVYKESTRLASQQLPITKEALKAKLDDVSGKSHAIIGLKRPVTFFEFADEFVSRRQTVIKKVTERSYKQTIDRIKDYSKESPEAIGFSSFDMTFFYGFKGYLEEEEYSQNTISKHFKNLKVFLNQAVLEGYSVNPLYKSRGFNVKPEQTTAIYLTNEEISIMMNHDLSEFKDLEIARDIFMIGLSTGQRVSDYNGLTKDNMVTINGKRFFRIKQKKTGKVVECLITPDIQQMMNQRYGGVPPKKVPEQHINRDIKLVGEKVKILDSVVYTSTVGGKEVSAVIPKHNLITTHTARRSFCTNKYKAGKPVIDIMHFSGHSGEREFYKYIRITGEERSSHLVATGFFD